MAIPLYTPRINNNDDTVRFTGLLIPIGGAVRSGEPVADVETDKAVFTVEAECDGYLLGVQATLGDTIEVGSILAWIGATPDEPMPVDAVATPSAGPKAEASLKAMMLLTKYGIDASKVPATGERLSAADVQQYIQSHGLQLPSAAAKAPPADRQMPSASGRVVAPTPIERGMLRTVTWHRDEAAAAYLEIRYDSKAWDEYAAEFQKSHKLLLNPLLSLFSWKLAQLAKSRPQINTTMVGDSRFAYDHVNLGFTVQVGSRLYVVVVTEAENMTETEFVNRLGELQRAAMKNALEPKETSGATIGFSSMGRWPVTRHTPLLLPHTTLMVAHTAPRGDFARMGVTYDHRILNGGDAVGVLQALCVPGQSDD